MRRSLVPILRCPRCGGALRLKEQHERSGWIVAGALQCERDGSTYAIRNGIGYLHDDGERWQVLSREAIGWVRMHQDRGMYGDPAGAALDLQLPYHNEPPWIEIAHAFDVALDIIQPRRGLRVLEVGAGRGWAARHLAQRGCNVTAVEINDDPHVGLGRVLGLMEHAGVTVDPLIADSEHLPLAEGSYDVVFASAAIHHSSSFDAMLQSVARVLRRGGRLVAINEPCLPDAMTAEALAASIAEEAAYDINENHGRLDDYRKAVRAVGLRERGLFHWHAYRLPPAEMVAWSAQLHVAPPTPAELADSESRWRPGWRNRTRRLLARLRADLHPQALPPAAWHDALMRTCGGPLIVVAERP